MLNVRSLWIMCKRKITSQRDRFIRNLIPRVDEASMQELATVKLVIFDFDGVFTKNCVVVSQDGSESVECSRLDGLGLSALRDVGIDSMVLSTEKNTVVSKRCSKLGISCLQDVKNKSDVVIATAHEKGVSLDHVMFLGNDINDKSALDVVGFPVGVIDSHPSILDSVSFLTNLKGGEGCVRALCDLLVEANSGGHNGRKNN